MKIVSTLLILCVCVPYLIHYGNAAGYVPVIPYGGVGDYAYGLGGGGGGGGGALLLLLALPLLYGFGGFGRTGTVIESEDARTRFANILIRRSPLTGQALAAYSEQIFFCTAANKDQAGCFALGTTCTFIPTVGLCLVA